MISILIPTKGRASKLARCVVSIPEKYRILILATEPKDVDVERGYKFFDKSLSVIEAQNFLAKIATGNILPATDDIAFAEGCLEEAEKFLYKEFPDTDGVVGLNVCNMVANDDAYMLIGEKFYKRLGSLFYSGYKHFYADAELGTYAKSLGRFKVCDKARIFNFHPSVYKWEVDDTHLVGRDFKLSHDKDLYERRLKDMLLKGDYRP